MLTLERITIENFLPYDGVNEIRLGLGAQPITVVHGNNGIGKSSLFNAIRWALYGEARDRSGVLMPTHLLLNWAAEARRDIKFSVKLEITVVDEGDEDSLPLRYIVDRAASGRITKGSKDLDFDISLSLHNDLTGTQQAEQARMAVETFLPSDITRFFLFDGEMLNEYEDLVREGGESSRVHVRHAIESILGLPSLTRTTNDVMQVREKIQSEMKKVAKEQESLGKVRQEMDDIDAKLASRIIDAKAHNDDIAELEKKLAEANQQLQSSELAVQDANKLLEHERALDATDESEKRHKLLRQEHASNLWRDVLHETLRQRIDLLNVELSECTAADIARREFEYKIDLIEKSLAHAKCDSCQQSLPAKTIDALRLDKAELAVHHAKLTEQRSDERIETIRNAVAVLSDLTPARVTDLIDFEEKQISECVIERYRIELAIKDLKIRLEGHDPQKISAINSLRDSLHQRIGAAKKDLEAVVIDIQSLKAKRQDLNKLLVDDNNPQLQQLRAQYDIAESLESILIAAKDRFVENLRDEVEKRATEIFLRLTRDKSYTGLKISRDYGLSILGRDGDVVAVRSAGYEQIVAFSLIGALNALAVKRGPLIMDTPFGRLDSVHRSNILEFLPELCEQVVLLVHDGEVDAERDLEPLRTKIAHEYFLRQTEKGNTEIIEGVA